MIVDRYDQNYMKKTAKRIRRTTVKYAQLSRLSFPMAIGSFLREMESSLLALRIRFVNQETPRRIPATIQIEATSKCNLRCPECSHSRENDSGQHLTVGDLERILDRLPFSLGHVILSGIGEPLLSPHFFSLIDRLAERHVMCSFYTNGTLLTPQKCEEIIQRRSIVSIDVSCDGAERVTFENSRLGASFEAWIRFVRYFLAKVKDDRPDLRVGVLAVITKRNLSQLEEVMRFVAELGFHSVSFLDPIPVDDIAAASVPSKSELSSVDFEGLFELGSALELGVSCRIRRDTVPPKAIPSCLQPWEYVFVRADGNVQPCMALFGTKKAAIVGNIFEQDFASIWNGHRFREFRRTSATGTNSLCRVCPYY